MSKITITGASDDLIEIDGDISEEFMYYPDDEKNCYLAVSDGTLITVRYDEDGIWRFDVIVRGAARVGKVTGDVTQDTNDVIDLELIVGGQFNWVIIGGEKAVRKP